MIANQPDSRTLRWRRYPEYKDSGVEWLGEIPEHWEVKQVKRTLEVVNGSTPRSEEPTYWDGEIPWVTPDDLGELSTRTLFQPRRYITEAGYNSCGTTMVPAGSLILSTRAPIGHLAIAGVDLCTNQGCRSLVFRTKSNKEFFYYQLFATRSELKSWGEGSTFRELSKTKLEGIELVNPPMEEQNAIAAFLDRETAKIDALVAKKERLIELLQEKRTALITQAVTKGLPSTGSGQASPNVPMKDSGVEWLGEIPAHWELRRNKLLFVEVDDRSEFGDEELLTVSHITGVTPRSEKEVYMFMAESTVGYKRCQLHDVAINTMWAYMGALGAAPCAGIVSPSYNVYRLRAKDLLPEYFDLICRTPGYITQINRHSKGVWKSRLRLYPDAFYEMLTPIPPIDEQCRIEEAVHYQDEEMQPLAHGLQTSIDCLKEYRTALISAAVTGRIDVREETA